MAVTASSALLQGTRVANIIQDTANKKTPALAAIPVLGPSNPAGPLWNFDTGISTVAAHAEGATFPAGTDSTFVQASLGWARLHVAAELTDEAISKAMMGNPAGIKNLRSKKLQDRLEDFLKYIQNQIFQGAGSTNNVAGIHIATDDTGTYAGINQATNSDFAGHVGSTNATPGTAAAITKKNFRDWIAAMVERSNLRHEELVFFTHETGVNRVLELYESQVRYDSQAMLGGVKPRVSFDGLNFITVPKADYDHPSDDATKCSISALHIDWSRPENGAHIQVLPYPTDDKKVLMSGLPYGIQVVTDPTGAHSGKWVLRTMLQLVVPNPKKTGVLNDIAI